MKNSIRLKIAIGSLLGLLGVVLYRTAWLGDDAFITFRMADNFINGYGLVWNVGERVLASTHPLWLLLISLFYAVTGEIFFTSLFLSILLTLTAGVIYAVKIPLDRATAILGLVFILLSKPFIDYATSGLENPLSYLLLVLFYAVYFRSEDSDRKTFYLSLTASLAMFNRMDTILLYLPVIVYQFFHRPGLKSLGMIVAGFIPFILWEIFSIFYYGFPFPNTAYAKLNSGVSSLALIKQGLFYFRNLIRMSPITFFIIAAGALYGLLKRSARLVPPSIGIILYLLYLLKIGGDFMSGRFFSVPFLAAVIILSQLEMPRQWSWKWAVVSVLVITGIFWPFSPIKTGSGYGTGVEATMWDHGITDERAVNFQDNGLLNVSFSEQLPDNEWADDGRELKESGVKFFERCGIGFLGFCAGPEVHILDCHALTDPLLARLPIIDKSYWRIGHFRRKAPMGYVETLETGENKIFDKDLARYYDKLSLLIRGDLFGWGRFKEIIKFNLGKYNELLDKYLSRPLLIVPYDKIKFYRPPGTPYNANYCYLLSETGLVVDFDSIHHDTLLDISVDNNDDYELVYRRDSTIIASQISKATFDKTGGLRVDTLRIPPAAVDSGYNSIIVRPLRGYGGFSMGHLRILK